MGGKVWTLSHDKLEELGKHFGFSIKIPKESPYYKEEKKTHTQGERERMREREREKVNRGKRLLTGKSELRVDGC